MTTVVRTRVEFAAARAELAELSGPIGLVPTMGALHAGHAALLHAARAETAGLVATIFVNPLQFGPTEDLTRYPRTPDADLAVCREQGVDLIWAPDVADVYPHGETQVGVAPGPLGAELEGVVRPTHFAGMLTVVAKLLGLVRPDRAYFGEKDYQQLTLVRRMALDLELGATIVGVPTVRDADGLALSSRNVYLDRDDRTRALALPRALRAGQAAASAGPAAVLAAARAVIADEPGLAVDYLELRAADLGPVRPHEPARLLVAARVGSTRLIDNVEIDL